MSKSKLLRVYSLHRFLSNKKRVFARRTAQKLGISRTILFRDLDLLKSIGAPVRYCRIRQIHYYEKDFHMSREEFFEKIL